MPSSPGQGAGESASRGQHRIAGESGPRLSLADAATHWSRGQSASRSALRDAGESIPHPFLSFPRALYPTTHIAHTQGITPKSREESRSLGPTSRPTS